MNWDHIEDNWTQFKSNVSEQWDDLTYDQLASRIRDTYGMRVNLDRSDKR